MKNKIQLLFCFYIMSNLCSAQPIKAYGNYIKNHCVFCFDSKLNYFQNYEVIVYFKNTDTIPDSISFRAGARLHTGSASVNYSISSKTNLCNKLIKVIYSTDVWGFEPVVYANARINNVKYIGNNVSDSIEYNIHHEIVTQGYVPSNNSSYFKDIPLVTIEKGKSNVINLFERDDDNDSLVFDYIKKQLEYIYIQNLQDVKIHTQTGDMFIPNTLDTGIYTLQVRVKDYYVNHDDKYSIPKYLSYTFFDFMLHVVNERLPYFNHFAAKIDQNGINNVYASPTDKTVNYQASYINPKGLGNYSVDVPATKPLNKPPTVKTTKINDTLLHINIDINLDSGYYQVYRDLPNSFSIIVTTTDSTGNCTQDLTSFYLTNNPTNSINEVTQKNKISIFPNPATTKVTIAAETTIKEIYIFDLVGKLVKQMNMVNSKTKESEIAIDELNQGIYIIQVIDVFDGKLSSKFIKE